MPTDKNEKDAACPPSESSLDKPATAVEDESENSRRPRRSARLQLKRSKNGEEDEDDDEEGDYDNERRNLRTRTERISNEYNESDSSRITSDSSTSARDNSTNTSTRDSSTSTSISTTNTSTPTPPLNLPPPPSTSIFSFTISFENGQPVTLPNLNNDPSQAAIPVELQEFIRRAAQGSGGSGGTAVIGVTGMGLPIMTTISSSARGSSRGGRSGTSSTANSSTSNSTNPNPTAETNANEPNTNDFLHLARQLIQIVLRRQSTSPLPESQDSADLETVLNEFFSRVFGASTSTTPAGLSPERIALIPEITDEPASFDCSICRDVAVPKDEKCVQLPCKHCFHFECIQPWLSRVASCPICRKVIE